MYVTTNQYYRDIHFDMNYYIIDTLVYYSKFSNKNLKLSQHSELVSAYFVYNIFLVQEMAM